MATRRRRGTEFRFDLQTGENLIPLPQRIFVNRNLKMQNVRMVGFDMDHTLVVYKKLPLERLAYDATRDKLIHERHYPAGIAVLQYDPDLVIRGLVVDKSAGNILKIDQHNYVVRACHGSRLVDKELRKRLYRNERIRLSSAKYMSIDTLYGLPEAALFLQLVDYFEQVGGTVWRDYTRVYDDVRECIDRAHADDSIKREIVAHPARFIERSERLASTLDSFISNGRQLFLLTNSEPGYTNTVMSYLLDGQLQAYQSWRQYFHLVVASARKPGFFHADTPLEPLPVEEMRHAGLEIRAQPVYRGGGAQAFETIAGFSGDEILYVGDHTFGDILRAKKRSRWRTAMVVEELSFELEREHELAAEYRQLDQWVARRNELVFGLDRVQKCRTALGSPAAADSPLLKQLPDWHQRLKPTEEYERRAAQLQDEIQQLAEQIRNTSEQLDRQFNKYWGRLFKCGQMNSRFGNQVKEFACVYTSSVCNFLAYPQAMYFRSPREIMPHEIGLARQ